MNNILLDVRIEWFLKDRRIFEALDEYRLELIFKSLLSGPRNSRLNGGRDQWQLYIDGILGKHLQQCLQNDGIVLEMCLLNLLWQSSVPHGDLVQNGCQEVYQFFVKFLGVYGANDVWKQKNDISVSLTSNNIRQIYLGRFQHNLAEVLDEIHVYLLNLLIWLANQEDLLAYLV